MKVKHVPFVKGFNNVVSLYKNKIAFLDSNTEKKFTYNETNNLVDRCLRFLKESGLKKNDTLQVILPNSLELIILFLAAGKGGFNFMPCSIDSTDSELILCNDIIKAKLVITEKKNKLDKVFRKKCKLKKISKLLLYMLLHIH